ncbi:MAG: recombinase family protein [Bacteriovoracia bacterium]
MKSKKSEVQKSKKIALYVRVSTEEQAQNPEGSIRNQEERLKQAVQLKNLEGNFGEIVAVFIDRAKSGKDTNRPDLQRLLTAVRQKEINFVMVTELSRLSRSIKDFAGMWELMQEHDCGFMSLRESFDTSTAAGEMVLYTVANIAQFERRQIAERTAASLLTRAQRGLYNGGPVPIGYKLIEDRPGYLAIETQYAEIVRHAFLALIREGSITQAAKWLNSNGYRMKRETQGGGDRKRLGHFTFQNLYNILRNKAYAGIRIYKDQGEIKETKAMWEPIVEPEIFFQVQRLMRENYRHSKKGQKNRYPFLLSGLVRCDVCKLNLSGKSAWGNGGKYSYYEHCWATKRQTCLDGNLVGCEKHRVTARTLEPAVWGVISKLMQDENLAKDIVDKARAQFELSSKSSEIKKCQEKLRLIQSQIETLAERLSLLPKSISPKAIFNQMEKFEEQKRSLEEVIHKLESESYTQQEPVTLENYRLALKTLSDVEIKEQVVRTLVRKIEVSPAWPDKFKLYYFVGERELEKGLVTVNSGASSLSNILRSTVRPMLTNGVTNP